MCWCCHCCRKQDQEQAFLKQLPCWTSGDSPVSPYLLLDSRAACTRHILFRASWKQSSSPVMKFLRRWRSPILWHAAVSFFVCALPFILQRVIMIALSFILQKRQVCPICYALSHSLDTLALFLNTLNLQHIFTSLHFADYLDKIFISLCFQSRAEGGALRESRSFRLLPVVVLKEIFCAVLIMSLLPFH